MEYIWKTTYSEYSEKNVWRNEMRAWNSHEDTQLLVEQNVSARLFQRIHSKGKPRCSVRLCFVFLDFACWIAVLVEDYMLVAAMY